MKTNHRPLLGLCMFLGASFFTAQIYAAAPDSEIVAVSSRASSDYIRKKLPDGAFAPEPFAFGRGGLWAGVSIDRSIDKIQFIDVARTLAGPLANKGYLSSRDPKATKLLIMVYWGKTTDPKELWEQMLNGSAGLDLGLVANLERQRINAQNANMLGYDDVWNKTMPLGVNTGPLSYRRHDLIDELEDRRYFVVLMAYDFQLLWKQKQHKLLWETRFSIRDRGHEFNTALSAMAKDASKYFGQDTHGIVHKELPEGKIEFGDIKVIADPGSK